MDGAARQMFFSIVVPVYNREKLIRRCVASVRAQDFSDYELVLVDDGSADNSLAEMRKLEAPDLKIIARRTTGGTGGARNTGVAAAEGDWIVFLDSDDELVPGALATLFEAASAAPDTVEGLWFRCRMDDGQEIPARLTEPQEWDYAGFVDFWNSTARQWRDMLYCNRRRSFAALPQPDGLMDDVKYLLDFARRYRIRAFPKVLRLYHQDAANQLVRITRRLDPRRDRTFITDRANEYRGLLAEHGDYVANNAPALHGEYLESAATTATMANRRGEAIGYALTALRLSPLRLRNWLVLAAAFIGPPAVILRRWTAPA
jgi:glycosyltransferase involved in cell wall biosynthesis